MNKLVKDILEARATGRPDPDPDDYLLDNTHPGRLHDLPSRRRTAPENPGSVYNAGTIATRYTGSSRDRDTWGFPDFSAYLAEVRKAGAEPGADAQQAADRIRNAATSYGSEGVGADGGFAVPPTFRAAIAQKVEAEAELLPRCDVLPISSSSLEVPKDETPPWSTSSVRAYWTGEGKTMTQSRPNLETSTLKLHKLTALVPITDELLEDAPAIGPYVIKRAATAINDRVNAAIIAGTGAGQPLGILSSGALIAQAKETSQVADTIHGLNLVKMWSRMPAAWRRDAVWLIHPDAEPLLMSAGLQINNPAGTLAVGGALAYVAAGGITDSPYASLFGRPVIVSQHCTEPGNVGDIIFASLPQYCIAMRAGGLQADSSIHLWFDQGVTAFRFQLRMTGQPWWSSPIPDYRGSGTRSAFVALAERA
jgi:HK97 family phage major capsid protein